MAATLKDNTRKKKPSKLVIDQYRDIFTWREQPVSEAFIERLASDLVKWALEDDDAFKLTQFILAKRMSPQTFYRWAKKYPTLGMAKDVALQAIGDRREIGAIKKKYDAGFVSSQMPKYDKSWWTLEVQRAELKARTSQKGDSDVTYKIVLDSYKDDEGKKTDNLPKSE